MANHNLDNDPYFALHDLQFPAAEQVFWTFHFSIQSMSIPASPQGVVLTYRTIL